MDRRELRIHRPGLTPTAREVEVLQLAAEGRSNRQIGRTLRIGEETVDNHMSAARRRLRGRTRAHTVALAWAMGVIR